MGSQTALFRKQDVGPRSVTGDEAVYRAVYDAILAHKLPPGTKLAEDSLGEVFGVSRTVIRKALFRLNRDRIVEIRPNRGAAVAKPSVTEALEVFQTRRILERSVIENLLGRVTGEELEALRDLVEQEQAAFAAGDRGRWIRLSGDFHLRLAEYAGNGVVVEFLRDLVSRTSLVIALYETPGNSACSFDEHGAILDAVSAADRAKSVELMDRHLKACEQKLNLEARDDTLSLSDIFGREDGN